MNVVLRVMLNLMFSISCASHYNFYAISYATLVGYIPKLLHVK